MKRSTSHIFDLIAGEGSLAEAKEKLFAKHAEIRAAMPPLSTITDTGELRVEKKRRVFDYPMNDKELYTPIPAYTNITY